MNNVRVNTLPRLADAQAAERRRREAIGRCNHVRLRPRYTNAVIRELTDVSGRVSFRRRKSRPKTAWTGTRKVGTMNLETMNAARTAKRVDGRDRKSEVGNQES